MGMPCQVNSIVKLNAAEFPSLLSLDSVHTANKPGYRIFPIDVPLQLVDEQWQAHADVVITRLIWEGQKTTITFRIHRCYEQPFFVK